jgi:hypothetical protein
MAEGQGIRRDPLRVRQSFLENLYPGVKISSLLAWFSVHGREHV